MDKSEFEERLCVECASVINSSAVKCARCGSYQNWRRYLPFGESSLAIVLSSIALAFTFVPDMKAPLKEVRDIFYGTNFAVETSLVYLNNNNVSLLVRNDEDTPAAINTFICSINFPLDPQRLIQEYLRKRAVGKASMGEERLTVENTLGPFIVSYSSEQPFLINPYDAQIVTLSLDSVTEPLRYINEKDANREIVNYCSLSGSSLEDDVAGGALLLTQPQLYDVDLLDLIQQAEYSSEADRDADRSAVLTARQNHDPD